MASTPSRDGGHTSQAGGPADPVLAALDGLAQALKENRDDEALLARRIDELRQARRDGAPWTRVLRAEAEPSALQLVSRIHARVSERSGSLRRAVVAVLRDEGASIPAIAQLFGVTHQRVSNLIRRQGH